jgi:hypothetical protein
MGMATIMSMDPGITITGTIITDITTRTWS